MLTRRAYMTRSAFVVKLPDVGSRKWLIAELDKYTSIIVRRRDGRCVTCGTPYNLTCSHFYSRRYLPTRFDLMNCNAQCWPCNKCHAKNLHPYFAYMRKTYGVANIEQLNVKRMSLEKMTDELLRQLLNEYKAMV